MKSARLVALLTAGFTLEQAEALEASGYGVLWWQRVFWVADQRGAA